MNTLFVDFETHDPHLTTMGPGWAYGLLDILCMGYKVNDEETKVTDDEDVIKSLVNNADIIVAHNAQYDIGILYGLMPDLMTRNIKFVDTVLMAKLYSNIEDQYSLNYLSKKYLDDRKTTGSLGEVVLKHKLINVRDPSTKLSQTKADNFAKKNMKLVFQSDPETVKEYCLQDVNLCAKLYHFYLNKVEHTQLDKFSTLLKILMKSRMRGVRIDSSKLHDIKVKLETNRNSILESLKQISGNDEFNPLSNTDIAQVLIKEGVKIPMTAKGNLSIVSAWLEEQTKSPVCSKIVEYRVLDKLSRDFCDNILRMQSKLPVNYKGRIYPTFNILGAETGRFSCKGPNLQQIPNAKKHKELGALIRSCYLPEEGQNWASLDYSAQEPRLQVHYASLIGAEGADLLVAEYNNNPNLDLHKLVADIAGIERNHAKTINLGLAYGMGSKKLSASLGLSARQGELLIRQYHDAMPYLKVLDASAKKSLKDKKYIKTLGGRKLRLDRPWISPIDGEEKTFEYKALNKLIQGGSADQIIAAMIALDEAGFTIISSIHDEINISVNSKEDAERARHIMENVVQLKVPSVAELSFKSTW